MSEQELFPCVGVCIPDEDETYCLGCGRPWGMPRVEPKPSASAEKTADRPDEPPPA